MVDIKCKICETQFSVHNYRKDKAKFCSYNCYWKDLHGNTPHNKGVTGVFKHTKEARGKISEGLRGRKLSEESHKKMSASAKKRGVPQTTIKAMHTGRKKLVGEKHPAWKGGYQNKLHHVRRRHAQKMGAEGSHSQQDWENLKKKYQYMCLCCKRQEPEVVLTEDHIVPLSKGGTDYIENIQPLCRSCNSRKMVALVNYVPLADLFVKNS